MQIKLQPINNSMTLKSGDFIKFKVVGNNRNSVKQLKKYEFKHLSHHWFLYKIDIDKKDQVVYTLVKLSNEKQDKINLGKTVISFQETSIKSIQENILIPYYISPQEAKEKVSTFPAVIYVVLFIGLIVLLFVLA